MTTNLCNIWDRMGDAVCTKNCFLFMPLLWLAFWCLCYTLCMLSCALLLGTINVRVCDLCLSKKMERK